MFKANKKTILTLLAFALMGSGMLFAHTTHAVTAADVAAGFSGLFGIGSITLDALNFVLSYLFYFIGFIAGLTFTFGGFLIDLALELNSNITKLEMVKSGWNIVLNLTNLAFVLGIIWIAIATILRNQSYGMKQILWKLIAAAVLVNFSLVIAGFFLDAAGIVTQFFIDKASPPTPVTLGGQIDVTFATQLAASLQPQGNLSVPRSVDEFNDKLKTGTVGTLANSTAQSFSILANLVFGSIFTVIGAITFLGIAILLLVRFVSIAILLVLAPLVWLGWVFPAMKQYWDMWWGNFLKWTFFAPASSFFLYLAILTALGKDKFIDEAVQVASAKGAGDAIKQALFQTLESATQQIIVIALMFGALIAAEKSGLYGAGAFKSMAQGVNKWVGDKAKSGALWSKNRSTLAFKGAAEQMAKTMQEGKGNRFTNLGRRFVVGQVAGAQKEQRDAIDAKVKAQLAVSPGFRVPLAELTDEDRVANALTIAKDKTADGSKLTARERDIAEKYGYAKEIIEKRGMEIDNRNKKVDGKEIPNTNPEFLLNELKAAEAKTAKAGQGPLTPQQRIEYLAANQEAYEAQQALVERSREIMRDWSPDDYAKQGQWISKLDYESGDGQAIIQAITQEATGEKLNKILNEIQKGNRKLALRNAVSSQVKIFETRNDQIKIENEKNKNVSSFKPIPLHRIEQSLKNVLENFGQVGTEGGAPQPAAPVPPPTPAPGGKP